MKRQAGVRQSFLHGAPLFVVLFRFVAARWGGLAILDLFLPSLHLEPVSPQQSGEFRFLVLGDAGLSARVQRSANLRDWEDWQALTLGAIPSELSDLDAGAVSHSFYRAVTP